MAKSVGQLIQDYTRANIDRHNMYCLKYRLSRDKKPWTQEHEERLQKAKAKKIAVSKVMRATLKKNGLAVIWGNRNHIAGVELLSAQKYRRAERKRQTDKYKTLAFVDGVWKLDLGDK